MHEPYLLCLKCGEHIAFARMLNNCPKCGFDFLDVRYDYAAIAQEMPAQWAQRPFNMWRYRELLPLRDDANLISMGEGGTPLIQAINLGMMLGTPNLYIKDERQGPTGSFKDRQACVTIAALKEAGLQRVTVSLDSLDDEIFRSMNDAGVGVKNGMNEHGMKNFIGTFSPPFAVINDSALLATLSDEPWIGGAAEAFKVALIKDARFFRFLCAHARALRARQASPMESLIRRCAALLRCCEGKTLDPL